MFKEYLVLTAHRQDLHVACQDYVFERHARRVMAHRAFQGIFRRYMLYCPMPATPDLLYAPRPETPLVVEHVCETADDFRRALADEDHKATIKPDEEHIMHAFLDGPPVAMEMSEHVVFEGAGAGRLRTFDFLARHADVDKAEFETRLAADLDALATDAGFRSVTTSLVRNIVATGEAAYADAGGTGASTGRAFDAVVEILTDDLEALKNFYPDLRRRQAGYVDPEVSFSLAAVERAVVSDRPLARTAGG